MKVCAIICEFNPFHNGHRNLIEQAKKLSGCDKIICVMSGSFTQRGDIAVLDKFTRARHAVQCGADAVIELPVSFSVAPAEIFARGAIKILSSVPDVTVIAFGCENPQADFVGAAGLLNAESAQFKRILSSKLSEGESYAKSYAEAFSACGGDKNLLCRPNNILAVEYAKAILKAQAKIDILPIERIGASFGDGELKGGFPSSLAIRKDPLNPLVKECVPSCVLEDLRDFVPQNGVFEQILKFKLISSDVETLRKIFGCTEGLENRLLNLSYLPLEQLISEATVRRYSSSRIKRILVANMLGLYADDCNKYLASPLYIKPIAVKKCGAEKIMAALAKSAYSLITRQRDLKNLNENAKMCFNSDEYSYKIWKIIANKPLKDFDYPIFI